MSVCPQCHKQYPEDHTKCPEDGQTLIPDAAAQGLDRDVPAGEMVGEYRIVSKLGEGGFGTVYRGEHPVIGKAVAIKVLSRQLSSSPEMVSRFIAEARAANQVRSRHIIDIFAFGALPDGRQYFVMELLDGKTLEDHLRERGRLSPSETVTILRGVARALDAAHAAGIVHRDLKPENVFLVDEEDGVVIPKLLDFGIAKLMGDATGSHKTRTGVPMGTPYYMSPEQCRGDKIDHHTDIYSLGVVSYQLLTGQLPFVAESFMQVMFKHVSGIAQNPSTLPVGLPLELDGPVMAMLSKVPSERPSSAGAAVEALAEAAARAGFELGASPSGVHAPMTPSGAVREATTLSAAETLAMPDRPGGSRRALLFGGLGVGLLAVVGLGAWGLQHQKPARQAMAPEPSALAPPVSSAKPVVKPVPPAAPKTITLTVQSVPERVDVFRDDEKLGTVPDDVIELPRGDAEVTLRLEAEGYKPSTITVTPSQNAVVSAKLAKKPASRPVVPSKPKAPKSELEF